MEYGLIGETLGHSFSKGIHEQLAPYTYELCPLSREAFPRFMEEKSFKAINVTIPYKEMVLPYLAEIDPAAKAIGAVNTIVNHNGRLTGYNTDYHGIVYLLRQHRLSLQGKTVMILGSGGTCKTATAVAKDQGAAEVIVVSRQGGSYQPQSNRPVSYEAAVVCKETQVLINASPKGMYPDNFTDPFPLAQLPNLEAVIDVIYNPIHTALIIEAEDLGIPAMGGLEMLIAQAKYAAELFLQTTITDQTIDQIYQAMLQDLLNIVLIAMPSAGKTTIGQEIARKLQRQFADTDHCIIEATNSPIPRIFEQWGEERFRKLEREQVQRLARQQGLVIATGGGVVKDENNLKALRQNGIVFFIDRPLEELVADQNRPLSSSREVVARLYAQRYPLYQAYSRYQVPNRGLPQGAADEIIRLFKGVKL